MKLGLSISFLALTALGAACSDSSSGSLNQGDAALPFALISNFEDEAQPPSVAKVTNPLTKLVRAGHWEGVTSTGATDSSMKLSYYMDSPGGDGQYVLNASGGSDLRLYLANSSSSEYFDGSMCSGIQFWAKTSSADDPASYSIAATDRNSASRGAYSSNITVTSTWTQFTVHWSDMTLPAGDAGADANQAAADSATDAAASTSPLLTKYLTSLDFESPGMELWIDDVYLTDCNLTAPEVGVTDFGPPITDAGPAGSPVAAHGRLQVVGTQLQDQSGQAVQLKGVSSFWLNWEGTPYAESLTGLEWMRDNWGLSVIRAAMGVDSTNGSKDTCTNCYLEDPTTMVAKVDTIVQNAITAGVYVIIDFHAYAAIAEQAQAITFFQQEATKWGQYPNVIFEDFNEPVADPSTGVRYTWAQVKAYHEAVVPVIRAIAPSNIIVMGTPTWSQDVDLASQDPVFPGDPVNGVNLMYTLHFYACTNQASLRAKGDTAMQNGIALFVTEFGATPSDGGLSPKDPTVCESPVDDWFTWMNAQNAGNALISGAAWQFWQSNGTSCILVPGNPIDGPYTTTTWTGTYTDATSGQGTIITDWIQGQW